jgi:hypothetical protein
MADIPDPVTTEWVPIWNPTSVGPVGPQGPQGDQGVQGEQGVQGVQGPTGAKGDKGDIGNTGPQGPVGVQGPQGETGPTGPVGPESDEIFVGPSDPGVASYDMWYDTDETPLPAGGSGHGTAHNAGGSDPITAISANIITTGTLVDARLSANVATKGAVNTFTVKQVLDNPYPSLVFNENKAVVDLRKFQLIGHGQELIIQELNDAETAGAHIFRINRTGNVSLTGGIKERGRSVPMGEWTSYTFFPVPSSGGSISSSGTLGAQYMIIGRTMWIQIALTSWYIAGNPTELLIPLPPGYNVSANVSGYPATSFPFWSGTAWSSVLAYCYASENQFHLNHPGYPAGQALHFWGTIMFPI